MNKESTKEYAKDQLESYLQTKGIDTRKNFKCLICGGGDKTPPMSYKDKRVHCFSCGFDGDIFDFIGKSKGLIDAKDIFEETYRELNLVPVDNYRGTSKVNSTSHTLPSVEQERALKTIIEPKDYRDYIDKAHKQVDKTNYFKDRGLSDKTIEKYKLGYDSKVYIKSLGKETKAAIIPIDNTYYTIRAIEEKGHDKLPGQQKLFNYQYLEDVQDEPIFVVEGEFDALSVEEVGAKAIGLLGVQNNKAIINKLKENKLKPLLIISFDNDDDPKTIKIVDKAARDFKKELDQLGIFYIQENISGRNNDPNEALTVNREMFKSNVIAAQEKVKRVANEELEKKKQEYMKNSAKSHIQSFKDGINASVNTPAISTGFDNLNKLLDGGLFEGLYIIGAISSLGKTTFVLQVADQMAQQGQDILIFSLEMARTELMAKSISRLTLLNTDNPRYAKTTRGITEGKRHLKYSKEERELIIKSISNYEEYANNIYISEGLGTIGVIEIRAAVQNHVNITGKTPIVIVDYLQILSPADPRASDKQNTDIAVLELKRISRDYKTPVIGISSLNRSNYNTEINMAAFKESGAIEYSSDVLIGLQYQGQGKDCDIEEASNQDPRKIELKILKNRNGGRGKAGFSYYPLFNYFKATNDYNTNKPTVNTQRSNRI